MIDRFKDRTLRSTELGTWTRFSQEGENYVGSVAYVIFTDASGEADGPAVEVHLAVPSSTTDTLEQVQHNLVDAAYGLIQRAASLSLEEFRAAFNDNNIFEKV
jgi:hypothetical protein